MNDSKLTFMVVTWLVLCEGEKLSTNYRCNVAKLGCAIAPLLLTCTGEGPGAPLGLAQID